MSNVIKNDKTKIEDLELAKETVQDLSEGEADQVQGGARQSTRYCHSALKTCVTNNVGC